jgi:dienelactone hydrolase
VPGVLWTPEGVGPFPLVLIGHGGGGHKRDASRLAMGYRYAREFNIASAAIDGPAHGERAGNGSLQLDEAAIDAMVADWRATLAALAALPDIDSERLGYGGVSMGTMFGIPFIAADARIRAAVLGLSGTRADDPSWSAIEQRLRYDTTLVRCPVLFLVQWDDELFPRDGAFELFELLGSADKRLLAHPGGHGETPADAADWTMGFLARLLRAPG